MFHYMDQYEIIANQFDVSLVCKSLTVATIYDTSSLYAPVLLPPSTSASTTKRIYSQKQYFNFNCKLTKVTIQGGRSCQPFVHRKRQKVQQNLSSSAHLQIFATKKRVFANFCDKKRFANFRSACHKGLFIYYVIQFGGSEDPIPM